jgi:hypothetical protein
VYSGNIGARQNRLCTAQDHSISIPKSTCLDRRIPVSCRLRMGTSAGINDADVYRNEEQPPAAVISALGDFSERFVSESGIFRSTDPVFQHYVEKD